MLIAVITGIGGGTVRDLVIDRSVFWAQDPTELVLCVIVAVATFFFVSDDVLRKKGMVWGDSMGLAAFGVVGCYVTLVHGVACRYSDGHDNGDGGVGLFVMLLQTPSR